VLDPQVKEASDPAFGESAVVAARQWRFLPRVKNGRAVETQVDMPFDFAPPSVATR
jgi:TonB family protein